MLVRSSFFATMAAQVDVKDFRTLPILDVRAHDVDAFGRCPRGDAGTLEQIEHRFLAAIGKYSLPAADLAEQDDVLAFVLHDLDHDVFRRRAESVGDAFFDLGRRMSFNAHRDFMRNLNPSIGADTVVAIEVGMRRYFQAQHIGTADKVAPRHALVGSAVALALHEGLGDSAAFGNAGKADVRFIVISRWSRDFRPFVVARSPGRANPAAGESVLPVIQPDRTRQASQRKARRMSLDHAQRHPGGRRPFPRIHVCSKVGDKTIQGYASSFIGRRLAGL